MGNLCPLLKSTIGRKLIMALTGLGLCLFLLAHVAGNLMILVSAEKYNDYAHMLTSNLLLLYSAEAGLIFIFLLHIVMAIRLTCRNRSARPVSYEMVSNTGRSRRTWSSSNMIISGVIILAFVVYHIWHFKFGAFYATTQNGLEIRDLSRLVYEEFSEVSEVLIYEIALLMLGLHLWHGFRSLWDTLGLVSSKWDCAVKMATQFYVVIVIGGFMLIPAWIYFCGGAA